MKSINNDSIKLIEYDVNVGTGHGTGQVIVPLNATDDEIRLAIINDLYDVAYQEIEMDAERSRR